MESVLYKRQTVVIPANGEVGPLGIPAAVVTPLSASGSFEVSWGDHQEFVPGDVGVSMPVARSDDAVSRFRFRDTSGQANTVEVAFSHATVFDNRENLSGPVKIEDPFEVALRNQKVFVRNFDSPGVSDEKSHVELANPAGSGVTIRIVGLRVATDGTGIQIFGFVGGDQSPLTGDELNTYATRIESGGVVTQGAALVRSQTDPNGLTPNNATGVAAPYISAGGPLAQNLSFLLAPDTCLRFYTPSDTGVSLSVGFQWIEEPL